jgi:uncharacterized protein (DUF1778 family)
MEQEKRVTQINVRFKPHERTVVEAAARREHERLSDFVRQAAIDAAIDAMTGDGEAA